MSSDYVALQLRQLARRIEIERAADEVSDPAVSSAQVAMSGLEAAITTRMAQELAPDMTAGRPARDEFIMLSITAAIDALIGVENALGNTGQSITLLHAMINRRYQRTFPV